MIHPLLQIVQDCFTITQRDLIRGVRDRARLYSSIIRPIIWLFLLGTGLREGFSSFLPDGLNMQQFIFPGLIVMNILFGGIIAGTSIIWDKEFGFLKEIMVAPVSRWSIVMGKTLSGCLTATFQGIVVLAFFPLIDVPITFFQIIVSIPLMFLIAISFTSIGMLLAAKLSTFEGFGVINNFLVMPMFFLSGALYPIHSVPQWLKVLIFLNPTTYAVDLLQGLYFGFAAYYALDILVLVGFSTVILSITVYFFNREGN